MYQFQYAYVTNVIFKKSLMHLIKIAFLFQMLDILYLHNHKSESIHIFNMGAIQFDPLVHALNNAKI